MVAVLVMGGLVCAGQVPPGVGAAAFARWGIDARPVGMGGAFVAVAEGSPTTYYNPAGLGRQTSLEVGAMYTAPYGIDFGVSLQYVNVIGSFAVQTASRIAPPGWGATWVGLTIDDITLYDDEGLPTVVSSYSSLFLGSAGIALPGADRVWVGVSLKAYTDSLLEGRSLGIGADLAVLAEFVVGGGVVRIGANAMDVGRTRVHWSGTTGEPDNYVPWVNKMGFAVELNHGAVLVAGDFDWAMSRGLEEQILHVGAEVRPVEWLALRGGWHGDLAGAKSIFSAGIGFDLLDGLAIDYAFVPGSIFGSGHVLSLSYRF